MVTGATSGLGRATAHGLAAEGARTVVVGRDERRCAAVAGALAATTGNADVEWLAADFSRQGDVRRLADEYRARHGRLHVLVNNAGAVFARRRVTAEGVEMTLAVNHLGGYLLTALLRDTLVASTPARVLNVASVAHRQARIDFEDLQLEHGYRPFRAYAGSKLANVLFTYELARRLEATGVTANAVDPGLVRTALGDKAGPLARVVWRAVQLRHRRVLATPEEASRPIVDLAAAPEVAGVTGTYFVDGRPSASSPASLDPDAATRLWEASARLTGL
jgi:retinol dehydrogenase-14